MKKLIYWIVGILIFFWIIGKMFGSGETVITDERTYNNAWREPTDEEFSKIGRLMIKNNVSGCGDYHVKEIEDGEYVAEEGKWTYYVAWINIDKIYRANEEMEQKLKPPH